MAAEWGWVAPAFPHGLRLTFVRGVAPERLVEAFGADPAATRWLTAEVTFATIGDPWVRVGRTGEWVFSFDNCLFGIGGFSPKARELSAGTELAHLDSLMSSGYFYYFADGAEVTSFEPLTSACRYGTEPDRFVPQMRRVGLDVDPPPNDPPGAHDPDDGAPDDPNIAVLEMLTLALGIRLSRGMALGPLRTARACVS
jgi:Family of unknown function (DUF6461)